MSNVSFNKLVSNLASQTTLDINVKLITDHIWWVHIQNDKYVFLGGNNKVLKINMVTNEIIQIKDITERTSAALIVGD